jgi:microcystin-dependent protein
MADPFIAQVQIWSNNFVPRGWGICQGALISISQNTALFSLIGNTYGGDGRISMGLPKLNGHAVMSWGLAPGLDEYFWGEAGGHYEAVIAESEMPSHSHGTIYGQKGNFADTNLPINAVPGRREPSTGGSVAAYEPYNAGGSAYMDETKVSTVGNGDPHENRQPFLALQFCIALMGQYPTRN